MKKDYFLLIDLKQLAEFGLGKSHSLKTPDLEDLEDNLDIIISIVVTLSQFSVHIQSPL